MGSRGKTPIVAVDDVVAGIAEQDVVTFLAEEDVVVGAAVGEIVVATGDDPVAAWHTVCDELEAYGAGLEDKPQIVALNKGDLLDEELMADISEQLEAAGAQEVIAISGATGQGVDKVLDRVIAALPDKSSVETSSGDNEEGEWSPI